MPKLYCRVNLRTDLQKRDRAGLRFNRDWTELNDVDEATLAALNEDPYLEVSDTPTVLVEVAAAVQTAQEPNNPPESTTQQDSADNAQGDSEQAGTLSATDVVDDQSVVEMVIEPLPMIEENIKEPASPVANEDDAANAAVDGGGDQSAMDSRMDAIKAAIAQLDPNNAGHWLTNGNPNIDALSALTGFKVLAAERDQAWNQIKNQAAAE
jgi:hypothetical protein